LDRQSSWPGPALSEPHALARARQAAGAGQRDRARCGL